MSAIAAANADRSADPAGSPVEGAIGLAAHLVVVKGTVVRLDEQWLR
ncbi:MAG: hypothetical protein R2698_11370 [Microthrixaceae bacterium]